MRPLFAALLLTVALPAQLAAQPTTTEWPAGIGFPNVARVEGALVAAPFGTGDGRGAILAWHNGVLFSVPEVPSSEPGSGWQVRMWSITDPSTPRLIVNAPADAAGSLGTTAMPVNAHGYFHTGQTMISRMPGPFLVLGPDGPPNPPWSFLAHSGVPGVVRTASEPLGAGVRGILSQPWYVEQTWWSYTSVGGLASLYTNGPPGSPGSQLRATWDHLALTGVVGHPFILGNLLIYASDQSRTGVATYDISDPAQPMLLDVLKTGGPGGYWPELWANDGALYVVFPYNDNGNGFRMVDVTDPTALRFVDDVPLPRPTGSSGAMYAQFQDEYGFIGDHKIDMRTRQSVLQFDSIGNGIDISQFALPLGNLLATGGVGEHQGWAIFAHQASPDLRPPEVAFHIPRAGQTNYPVGAPISLLIHETLDTLSLANGSSLLLRRFDGPGLYGPALAGRWVFSFDDVLTFQPDAALQPAATYEMRLDGVRDAAGNAMPPYAFTFSTGGALAGNRPPAIAALEASSSAAPPGVPVELAVTAADPDGDALQYRFDFGDGTPRTSWLANGAIAHPYAAEGHYRASAQVRDPTGAIDSRSVTVNVLAALPAARPDASSSVLCDTPRRRVWTVNRDADTVSVVDADMATKLDEHPACDDPRSIARDNSGALWIACFGDDRLQLIDETDGNRLHEVNTGYASAPVAVLPSASGASMFALMAGRAELRRYDTATRALVATAALPAQPRGLARSADGTRLLVTRFHSPEGQAEVWEFDATTLQLLRTLRIPKFGGEENADTPASGRGVANQLAMVAHSPRSGDPFVVANKPNTERGGLIAPGVQADSDNTVRNLLVQLDLAAGGASNVKRAIDLDNSDSASAIAFSPQGDYLIVALQGNDEVLVLDALALQHSTGLGALVTRLAAGGAPQGVCTDPPTQRSFVHNFLGRSLTVLETEALFARGSLQVHSSEVQVVANETLVPDVLRGKRLFYRASDPRMSAEGYLSCATCHLDGEDDGRTWDFTARGEGLRNTTVLNGRGGMAHGNVHWSGNFDEIQDFEADIRLFFGGTGFLAAGDWAASGAPLGAPKAGRDADLDALATYVASLDATHLRRSPFRRPDGGYTAEAMLGAAIFEREGCTVCHAPPRYTDSAAPGGTLHDVGTLRSSSGSRLGDVLTGIDTPTLLGLFATPPYFHDGSAPTLEDVFRVTGGQRLPAESAVPSGGATLVDEYVELNNDDTVRGRAYVLLESPEQRLLFAGVAGGSGGEGALELRYSTSANTAQTQSVSIRINGEERGTFALPGTGNEPNWRATRWRNHRIEGLSFAAGDANTVELRTANWYLAVDEIVVSSPSDAAAALPHRRVSQLPAGEQEALIAFLRQLDRSSASSVPASVFADGFESPE